MNNTTTTKIPAPPEILPLLGNLSEVPKDYISQIANIKRVLERWTMDPDFRQAFDADPEAALAETELPVSVEEIFPLVNEDEGRKLTQAIKAGTDDRYPLSVRRYRAYYREKRQRRTKTRELCRPSHPNLAAWRARQINRCVGQLGLVKADALVHAPAAFELSQGCSGGCWFCGVDAAKFEGWWPYTEENGAFWRATLEVLKDIQGPAIKQGFMYWATDGLDNKDYDLFLRDFHKVTGRCPQTTTALAARDVEWTRHVLQTSQSLDSEIDRFSIVTLDALNKIHAAFSPEELLQVECIPQNLEALDKYRKAQAGRARRFAKKRSKNVMPDEATSTIACVSGFLFNMPERTVKFITPCNASERWPLGYWVLAESTFNTPTELRSFIEEAIAQHAHPRLRFTDTLKLRPDLNWTADADEFCVTSVWLKVTFRQQQNSRFLLEMLEEGDHTAEEIALLRERDFGTPLEETFYLLCGMYQKGLFDEEPQRVIEHALSL